MQAIRIHRFGPPEVMQLEDIEPPQPAAGQVLVRVHAAGVGPWDGWVRAGKSALDQPLPLTLGSDLAGRVTALGPDVSAWALGDAVFGVTGPGFTGAYAEYALAQADMIARKPRSLSYGDAAAVPVVAVTALQMLFEHAQLQPGQRVLIQGAGGSVGGCALQLAAAAGAHVIASALHPDDQLAQLGAAQVIDASRERFEASVDPVDVVIDTVGGDVQRRSLPLLVRGGILVSAVQPPEPAELARYGVRGKFMLVDVRTPALQQIARALDEGRLSVRVGTRCPLASARDTHDMLEGRLPRAPGKIVLLVHEPELT